MSTNNISRQVKFFGIDGISVVPLFVFFLAPSFLFMYCYIAFVFVMIILSKRGFSIPMLFRKLRTKISGSHKFIRSQWRSGI